MGCTREDGDKINPLWFALAAGLSFPTVISTVLGRENLAVNHFNNQTQHEFWDAMGDAVQSWPAASAGFSSWLLNTVLGGVTQASAFPVVKSMFTCKKPEFCTDYIAAIFAVPAALTFAMIAYDTFEFRDSNTLAIFCAVSNFLAYYGARTAPLIHLSKTLNKFANTKAGFNLSLVQDGQIKEGADVALSDISNLYVRSKMQQLIVYLWFCIAALISTVLALAVMPVFAKDFNEAAYKMFGPGAQFMAENNYKSKSIVIGYLLSALPSLFLYTSFNFKLLNNSLPQLLLHSWRGLSLKDRKCANGMKIMASYLSLPILGWMAYESGYAMKSVGIEAKEDGVISYLGEDIVALIPVAMELGASLVNLGAIVSLLLDYLNQFKGERSIKRELRRVFSATSAADVKAECASLNRASLWKNAEKPVADGESRPLLPVSATVQ